MLACFECRNLTDFTQVSDRGDARTITNSPRGVARGTWDAGDARPAGLYCAKCSSPVEADVEQLELTDDRLEFVSPLDFDADVAAERLMGLRPDASWTRLELPEISPRFAAIPSDLHLAVSETLYRSGRNRLFCHQSQAIEAALRGEQVVQATPAGSGKSLGFVVPVLDALVRDPSATALLLFPLRALANDQLDTLQNMGLDPDAMVNSTAFDLDLGSDAPPIRVARLDGTTKDHEKRAARDSARLLITTPDSLHASILRMSTRQYRDGTGWARLMRGLRFVVLDEIHTYQGVFGSNVANVLRRLRRVTDLYRAQPQFLAASATIGNPGELAERVTGAGPFTLIDDDGSHHRRRIVLVCNPPERAADPASVKAQEAKKEVAGGELDGRLAPQTVAIDLVTNGALHSPDSLPVRTIAFCRSRNAVFQLAERIRAALREARRADLGDAVSSYAATFAADDREEEEGRLRDGSTLAIVSTSALELGIDIPDLSIAILVGYPGQISSFRQRIGRAGRAGEGLGVLVVGDDPLQQYLATDPGALQALLDAPAESIVINPDAPEVLRRYGLRPAQEEFGGLAFEDERYFGSVVNELLAGAHGAPAVERAGNPYWCVDTGTDDEETHPGIRSAVSQRRYVVLHQSGRDFTEVGVIDESTAPRDAFVPAIWTTPKGLLYRIVGFDDTKGEIYCEGPVDSGFQTRGISVDRVTVRGRVREPIERPGAAIGYGRLSITRQVFSYKQLHFSGVEKTLSVERMWAPVEFDTMGLHVFLDLPRLDTALPEGSIDAVEHLLLSVGPAIVACDPYDLESTSDESAIYLYDSFGGDIGLTEALHERFDELVDLALRVVSACSCERGCPSCIMLSRRPDGNKGLSKTGAIRLLEQLRADPPLSIHPDRDRHTG
jgi:DEAD/DEAH box helicase domain-containing protein